VVVSRPVAPSVTRFSPAQRLQLDHQSSFNRSDDIDIDLASVAEAVPIPPNTPEPWSSRIQLLSPKIDLDPAANGVGVSISVFKVSTTSIYSHSNRLPLRLPLVLESTVVGLSSTTRSEITSWIITAVARASDSCELATSLLWQIYHYVHPPFFLSRCFFEMVGLGGNQAAANRGPVRHSAPWMSSGSLLHAKIHGHSISRMF